MKRQILIKISGEGGSPSHAEKHWAGMQYEDNATELVFDLSAIEVEKALYRIDFNSVTAGYFPGENLIPDSVPSIGRGIPKYLTQYGGELEAVAVITPLSDADEPTGEVLSYPVKLYFTSVSRDEEGEAEIIPSLSALERDVKRAVAEAEALVFEVEERLENGEFRGEKGDKGDKGDSGLDAQTDQTYNPQSPNAQSGKAVAEAIDTKANLELRPIEVEELAYLGGLKVGNHIYELARIEIVGSVRDLELYFKDGTHLAVASTDVFKVGKKYLISTTLDPEYGYLFKFVAEAVELEDKIGADEMEKALNSLEAEGNYKLIETIEVTTATTLNRTEEPDGTPYNFKAVFIQIETSASAYALTRWYFQHTKNSKNTVLCTHDFSALSNNTKMQRSFVEVRPVYGWWNVFCINWTQYNGNMQMLVPAGYRFEANTEQAPTINRIYHSATLPAGTTVKIWGVRA